MAIRDDIYEYENTLSEFKKELNTMSKLYLDDPVGNSKLLLSKIDSIKNEIDSINYQLNLFKVSLLNSITNETEIQEKNEVPNSIRENIYSFEEKLAIFKNELNNLTKAYLNEPKSNSKLLSSKINSMKNEIEAINYQLNIFKISLLGEEESKTIYEAPTTTSTENIHSSSTSNTKDLENTIGKSFMGILASILIFISFILFASLLYPLLTDGVKITAMYLISALFTLFGLLKLKKYPKNKLYLSITGCGVGALYISLILSNVYFKVIGDIILYLLIFAWAIFTAYLSRLKSNIFSIIGQAGISIALIFGNSLCIDTNDIDKFFILNIFFVITAFLFNTSKIYSKNIANTIFNVFNLFLMHSAYCDISHDINSLTGTILFVDVIPFILLGFIIYKLFASYTLYKLEGNNIDFAIINTIYIYISFYILDTLLPSYDLFTIIAFSILILFIIFNEIKFKNNLCIGRNIFQIILMIFLASACFELDFINNYLGLSILALPFIIYGFYSKDNLFKYAGLIAFGIYIFQFDLYELLHFGIGFVIFSVLTYFILNEKEQYSSNIKIITYILFLIFGVFHISNIPKITDNVARISSFIFLSFTNLIFSKSFFKRDFVTGNIEELTIIVTRIINAGLMIWSLNLISDSKDFYAITQMFIILISLALFLSNTRNLLKKYDGLGAGIYIGIKLTVLMLVILNAWEASNIVISISCLLFAILGIVLGFYFRQKSFRIYGLGLTLISTVKLIMVDIAYENSIGHAFSFFLSGILCFAISAIYNLIDKKFLKDNNSR